MDYIAGFFWGVFVVVVFLDHKGWIKRPLPYRWVCTHEGCEFSCSSSELSMNDNIASKHIRSHEES